MLAALTLAAGLVACGDDDSSGDDTQPVGTSVSDDTESSDDGAATTVAGDATSPSDSTGSSTPGSVNEEFAAFCEPMEELANFNADAPTPDPGGSFEELQEQLLSVQDDADGLYGAAIENAPAEIADDLQRLADYTEETFDAIAEASSADEVFEFLTDTPEEVLEATTNLNAFIKENCGFELTSGL
jgi:hypothetical protein